MQSNVKLPSRLEAELAAPLQRLHTHELWHELATADASTERTQAGLALALAEWSASNLLCALRRAQIPGRTPWVPAADGMASRAIHELSLLEEGCERAPGEWTSRCEAFRGVLARIGLPVAAFDAFLARLRSGERLRLAFSLSGLPAPAVSAAQQWQGYCERGWAHEIAAAHAALRLALPLRGFSDHCVARMAAHPERDAILRPWLELTLTPAGSAAALLAERLAASRPEGMEEISDAARGALAALEMMLDQLMAQAQMRRNTRSGVPRRLSA
jgi:hypothetical protein